MHGLVAVLLELLEGLFVVGLLGSAAVVLLTTCEDLRAVLEKEVPLSESEAGPRADTQPAASAALASPLPFSAS